MRVQWVHPSWRDLVIEHLASDSAAREHFLRTCGIHGAMLALSLAGGAAGERQRPLLKGDADWDALSDRIYALLPELDHPEVAAILEAVAATLADALSDAGADRAEADALARMLLGRLRSLWDAAHAPIPLAELDGWLTVASRLSPAPALPSLSLTWAELLAAGVPSFADRQELERFADWLTLVGMLRRARPDALTELGFRRHHGVIKQYLEAIGGTPRGSIVDSDPIIRALHEVATIFAEDVLATTLWREAIQSPGVRSASSRRAPGGDDPDEPREPRLFDVSRVLEDL